MPNPFLRAITVSVDYADILSIVLPWNRHHFKEYMIVTCESDEKTIAVAKANDCSLYLTEEFWEQGAHFNKFRSLESGLDAFGRHGWITLLDADTLWPKETGLKEKELHKGYLYTPRRHICDPIPAIIPPEDTWKNYPLHMNEAEWAGYSQIFNGLDPVLGATPWHDVNWTTAGGADSWFQRKWLPQRKIRPRFKVLHLGATAENWAGRVTPYVDGTLPAHGAENRAELQRLFKAREGKSGMNRFSAEKLH
jgi:hypothetical protein